MVITKLEVGSRVLDLVDSRVTTIAEIREHLVKPNSYRLEFDSRVDAFTGTGRWRQRNQLKAL